MASSYTLDARTRADAGKGASRRLRRLSDEVPAIVYGGGKDPVTVSLPHKDLSKALEDEGFYSHVIGLSIDGKVEQVLLKDLQRHPAKPKIVHADFLRVDTATRVTMRIPIHFLNEDKCVGVKMQGGMIQHNINEIEVRCLPQDLPEFIPVDMAELGVGEIVHISNLPLPKGVESVELSHGEGHDQPVVSVLAPRGGTDESEGEADDASE